MAVMVGERLVLSGQRVGLDPNLAVRGSSPALATCWICSWLSLVQFLGHACSQQICLPPVGVFNPSLFGLFVSNYLSRGPVS